MSMKSTNFATLSTEIDEESDSECDIDINDEQATDNEKSNMPPKKVVITLICIFFFLVTAAIIFGVSFGIFGLHKTQNPNRPKSSIEKCDNLRCCKFKSLEIEAAEINIACTSLQIEECVSNDDVCDWNCDLSTPAFLHRTFLRFDPGIGAMSDAGDEVNDNDINTAGEDVSGLSGYEAFSVDDYLRQSKMLSYTECGDVYEVDEDYPTATERFSDTTSSHISKGPNEDTIRRLSIFPPDGRVASSVTDMIPFKSVGLLIAQGGGNIKITYGCTATLISRRVIITAAACVYDRSSSSFMSLLRFYPDIVSWSADAPYFEGIEVSVPQQYIDDADHAVTLYNWALIRLSTNDTGKGWIPIGYDNNLAPLTLNSIGYPLDKGLATRWVQHCYMGGVSSTFMISNDCDEYYGQWGEAMYAYWSSNSTDARIIYGVWNSYGTYNYYARIDSSKWFTICDFISAGEDPLCSY